MKSFLSVLAGCFLVLVAVTPGHCRDYVIGGGDVLDVSVWGVEELSGEVTVRPDGKITLPAAGEVVAEGKTPADLSKSLTQVLEDFVKKPIVTVRVTQITNNKVYVAGNGVPSRAVSLPARTTLFKFLCTIPELENGDLRRAYLIREGQRLRVDFHKLLIEGDLSQDIKLHPEDIIFIPSREQAKIYILGAVEEPRFIYFRDGMKVLDAILEAGGFNEYAKINSLVVHRLNGSKIKILGKELIKGKDTGQNIHLEPGDYITVEEGMF